MKSVMIIFETAILHGKVLKNQFFFVFFNELKMKSNEIKLWIRSLNEIKMKYIEIKFSI